MMHHLKTDDKTISVSYIISTHPLPDPWKSLKRMPFKWHPIFLKENQDNDRHSHISGGDIWFLASVR